MTTRVAIAGVVGGISLAWNRFVVPRTTRQPAAPQTVAEEEPAERPDRAALDAASRDASDQADARAARSKTSQENPSRQRRIR